MSIEKILKSNNPRGDCYKLLADCYYKPDEQLLNKLRNVDASIGLHLGDISKDIPADDQLASLAVDFSRLFVGPFKLLAYPYESAYLDGGQQSVINSSNDVEQQYRKEGLDIVLKEASDHIAIELEFVYFLIAKEVEARNIDATSVANDYVKKQKLFLQDHLGKWVSEFANNVQLHAQTEFYKNLANLTMAFVEADLERVCKWHTD